MYLTVAISKQYKVKIGYCFHRQTMQKEEREYENYDMSENEEKLDRNLYGDNLTTFTSQYDTSDSDY